MSELLIEVLSSEIPARMQEDAHQNLASSILKNIQQKFDCAPSVLSFATPRRITVTLQDLTLAQKSQSEEVRGPKTDAPAQALDGFLKKHSLTKEQLTESNGYYYATIGSGASSDTNQIITSVLQEVLNNFVWPKSMKWGADIGRWVRPIKSILAVLDGKVLNITMGGIKADNKSSGHRFLSPNSFEVSSVEQYINSLQKAEVMLSAEDRKETILVQVESLLSGKGVKLIKDQGLLNEIAGLVEKPTVFLAQIDDKYMSLPKEVLVIALRHHQRYLMTEYEDGRLAPYYFIVSNIPSNDKGASIVDGNRKVLNARLEDAQFFYDQDRKHALDFYVGKLESLTYHKDLGSVLKKQQSVLAMATHIAKAVGYNDKDSLETAVMLSKADLVTNMVKEFPELQGIIGYYYSKADGLSDDISHAIRDHYKPQGPNDSLPTGVLSWIIALADKLDTLNQLFGINIKPTGSKDPFALRRAAIGIIRIMIASNFALHLSKAHVRDDVREFIKERLDVMLKSEDISADRHQELSHFITR
jgi:glycyl-tRNA synthetase beta chain